MIIKLGPNKCFNPRLSSVFESILVSEYCPLNVTVLMRKHPAQAQKVIFIVLNPCKRDTERDVHPSYYIYIVYKSD